MRLAVMGLCRSLRLPVLANVPGGILEDPAGSGDSAESPENESVPSVPPGPFGEMDGRGITVVDSLDDLPPATNPWEHPSPDAYEDASEG